MKKRAHILVSGRVQGVSFRYYTQRQASALGLQGYVWNLPDGRVEIVVEGEEQTLKSLITWAHTGPPAAEVKEVMVEYANPTNEFMTFGVQNRGPTRNRHKKTAR